MKWNVWGPRNPFSHGGVVEGEQFADREQETAMLVQDALSGQDVVVISPRRYGKTSLMFRVSARLREEGALVAYVDLRRSLSKEALADQVATAVYQSLESGRGRLQSTVLKWLRQFPTQPQVGVDAEGKPTLTFTPAQREQDVDRIMEGVFHLPGQIARERQRLVVLVFDEFQDVERFDKSLKNQMRAVFQNQRDVAHLYLGSERHLMTRLFTDPGEPFYRSAKHVPLGVLPAREFADFIHVRFASTNMTISAAAVSRALALTRCHPNDTQQLCAAIWSRAALSGVSEIDEAQVDAGLADVAAGEERLYGDLWDKLSKPQQQVLVALVQHGGPLPHLYTAAVLKRFRLASASSVQGAIRTLGDRGLVEGSMRAGYDVPDAFFRAWIRLRIIEGRTEPAR